ncbi:Piso0_005794 [Millerozyma farinosa CBS 7064]|uniref:Piso0_005794 protein n=1 Tax=Pichia sorbitophila (strain ATCC MYA-4447 / BCRC 22081 / CBS 7064 / NBRC 10061 / NRRL Y-12695) TaxID=559304 RepID=G8XZZ2_PICSO|nr:Piso0_005794 [Millerozyma farinosa CBS 7064]
MDEQPASEQIKISVFTPIIYVGVLLSSFIAFSIIYRKRRLEKLVSADTLFSENHAQNLYEFLKEQYNDPNASSDTKPHLKVMKAALLRRGAEAIRRSLKLKENEPIFNRLYQEGHIGDATFKSFTISTKLQEIEIRDIVIEVENMKKGWTQQFFATCQEICFNEALRRRLNALDERHSVLSELWEYTDKDVSEKADQQAISNTESDPSSEDHKSTPADASQDSTPSNNPSNSEKKSKNKKKSSKGKNK